MKLSESFEMYQNLYKSGMNKAIQNAMRIQEMGMNFSKVIEGGISNVSQSAQIMKGFQTSYQDNINGLAKALEDMQNKQIKQLGSAMQFWQSNMELIQNDFLYRYNSIMINSMGNLTSEIAALNINKLDISSLGSLRIDDFDIELDNIKHLEFDEELEKEIDLQEIETIVNSKIENVKVSCKGQDCDMVFAINALTAELQKNNSQINAKDNPKETIRDNVVSAILVEIILRLIYGFTVFVLSFTSPYMPAVPNNNYIVKTIKKEVRTIDIDNNFYNTFRIVIKDGLEVRRTSNLKSGIKYYLDFGDLVKIEHKNKNWTKIRYTNVFTGEEEIGWVLTRYIKRLD